MAGPAPAGPQTASRIRNPRSLGEEEEESRRQPSFRAREGRGLDRPRPGGVIGSDCACARGPRGFALHCGLRAALAYTEPSSKERSVGRERCSRPERSLRRRTRAVHRRSQTPRRQEANFTRGFGIVARNHHGELDVHEEKPAALNPGKNDGGQILMVLLGNPLVGGQISCWPESRREPRVAGCSGKGVRRGLACWRNGGTLGEAPSGDRSHASGR